MLKLDREILATTISTVGKETPAQTVALSQEMRGEMRRLLSLHASSTRHSNTTRDILLLLLPTRCLPDRICEAGNERLSYLNVSHVFVFLFFSIMTYEGDFHMPRGEKRSMWDSDEDKEEERNQRQKRDHLERRHLNHQASLV